MINTEIQAINIGTTQASALYIGTTQIWSGSTPSPQPLPNNMERQEFIPENIMMEYGQLQPIDVTLGNVRVYSRDSNTFVGDMFYVPNTDSGRYYLCVSSSYVYSIEIEFSGGTEEFVGGNSSSRYSYDQAGTYTISNNKLTWEWNAEAPVRYVNFYNVASPDEYGEIGLEITKITVVAAHQTVTSLNQPTVTSVSNGDGTAQVTITSGNSDLNTSIFYDYDGNQHVYSQPITITEGASISDIYETYTEYPFSTIHSESVSYTVPIPATPDEPVTPGTYQFLPADDEPISTHQQYTLTRGGVQMTVSDGLTTQDHYRIYANKTITIDAGDCTITSINFKFVSGYNNNGTTTLTADSGTCVNNYATDLTGEWTGSASTVVITTTKQIRLTQVTVVVE